MDIVQSTPTQLVDLFISDCTMPSTSNTEQANIIYDVFVAYCKELNMGVPCGLRFFGKLLKKRFQRRGIDGRSHYFMEFKEGLFDANN